jgi:hypothetical protein
MAIKRKDLHKFVDGDMAFGNCGKTVGRILDGSIER